MLKESLPYRYFKSVYLRKFKPLGFDPGLLWAAPGHFYSPLPSADDRARRAESTISLPGIETRDDDQLALMRRFSELMPPPFEEQPTETYRYGYRNPYFGYADAAVFYAMLRTVSPRRVIEVGSGYSSAVLLDTAEHFLNATPALTFIEPFPDRLRQRLKGKDAHHEILPVAVQDVPLARFSALESNDILFIDSSHVAKVGSDVTWLFRHVIPTLAPGVLVHIHDLFWPFEYPASWINEGRAWNEAYLVHAFLQFNKCFEIVWFTSYLAHRYHADLRATMPLAVRDDGGSLWIKKVM